MRACCDDTSSDDDEHNTSNTLLLLFADVLNAPVLLTGLCDVDELMVALGCRFALWLMILGTLSGSELRPLRALIAVHRCHFTSLAPLMFGRPSGWLPF